MPRNGHNDATLNLSTNYRSNGSDAAAVGYGDIVYKPEQLVADPSIATNDQIRIGSYKGKLVQLKLEARALSRDDEYSYFWNLYETLIPDENGLIDMQLLTLPYVQNYGWAINVLEMTVIDDPCNGNHDFGWVNRQSCHVWACRNKDCQARDPAAEIVFCPVLVQGEEAPGQLIDAVRRMNRIPDVDVLIIGRGGGSLEDLWAFNDEGLARAIADSRIPVISAVGHETDFTICDFAADLRAPTPSAAAELAVPDIREYEEYFRHTRRKLEQLMLSRVAAEKSRMITAAQNPVLSSPLHFIERRRILLDTVSNRLNQGFALRVSREKNRFSMLSGKLDALSPFRVLGRGYSLTLKEGNVVKTIRQLEKNDQVTIKLLDGEAQCQVLGLRPEKKEETYEKAKL